MKPIFAIKGRLNLSLMDLPSSESEAVIEEITLRWGQLVMTTANIASAKLAIATYICTKNYLSLYHVYHHATVQIILMGWGGGGGVGVLWLLES